MQYNTVNGKRISRLGFGGMRFPERDGKIDYEAAAALVDEAYKGGVNYFDTAYMYHGGQSEAFFGRALARYPRDSYFLADKLPGWLVGSKQDAERIFNEQLTRCRTDYFDFYLCHALNRNDFKNYEELGLYDVLTGLKAQGKIKSLGFSFHDSAEALDYIAGRYDWDFVQLQLNYLDWTYTDAQALHRIATDKGLPVIVMEPVRGGALATLSPEAADILKRENPARSIASWAIRYAFGLPGVMTVLSGMSAPDQVRDNLASANLPPLTEGEQAAIIRARECFLQNEIIPCTGCRYCMDCTVGIDIPQVFRIYNDTYAVGRRTGEFTERYGKLTTAAGACVGCDKCRPHCPQGIDIPARLARVHDIYRGLAEKD